MENMAILMIDETIADELRRMEKEDIYRYMILEDELTYRLDDMMELHFSISQLYKLLYAFGLMPKKEVLCDDPVRYRCTAVLIRGRDLAEKRSAWTRICREDMASVPEKDREQLQKLRDFCERAVRRGDDLFLFC